MKYRKEYEELEEVNDVVWRFFSYNSIITKLEYLTKLNILKSFTGIEKLNNAHNVCMKS